MSIRKAITVVKSCAGAGMRADGILSLACAVVSLLIMPNAASAQSQISPPGTIDVPSFKLPPSVYLSPEARALLEARKPAPPRDKSGPSDVKAIRAAVAKDTTPAIAALRARFPVQLEETRVGGVHGYWVRSRSPRPRSRAVLINLHGGGFFVGGADDIGLAESIPIAGLTHMDVLTIDYRQAPEATFPAASEDVEKVYRALLRTHAPSSIGIYGCSAGGLLTAQALAWFQAHHLPRPGAAGILCASADGRWGGDSWNWQKPLEGSTEPPSLDEAAYYGGHDLSDPLLSPMVSDRILAGFPPTLIITATRGAELSSAVNTHRLLVRNGVEAELHVWDGLGHAFFANPSLPESMEAYQVIARFFEKHLRSEDVKRVVVRGK